MITDTDVKVIYQGDNDNTVWPISFPFVGNDLFVYIRTHYDEVPQFNSNLPYRAGMFVYRLEGQFNTKIFYVSNMAMDMGPWNPVMWDFIEEEEIHEEIYNIYNISQINSIFKLDKANATLEYPISTEEAPAIPLTEEQKICIVRDTNETQLLDSTAEQFKSSAIERSLDKVTKILQENAESIRRSGKVNIFNDKGDEDEDTKMFPRMRQWFLAAKRYAKSALNSDNKAAQSAAEAKESAEDAKLSEQNAANSASNAFTSEVNAKTSEQNAASSAEQALTSASSASDSMNVAMNSAVESASSAQSAYQSEQNAATSAVDSQESANDALLSESNAKESEENAAQSEQNASQSAILSESWAVGGTNSRDGEDTNNSKYWSGKAQDASDGKLDKQEYYDDETVYLTAGAVNNYTVTAPMAFEPGLRVTVQFHLAQTSATCYINYNDTGAIRLYGAGTVILASYCILNSIHTLYYNGTAWYIEDYAHNIGGNAASSTSATTATTATDVTYGVVGSYTYAPVIDMSNRYMPFATLTNTYNATYFKTVHHQTWTLHQMATNINDSVDDMERIEIDLAYSNILVSASTANFVNSIPKIKLKARGRFVDTTPEDFVAVITTSTTTSKVVTLYIKSNIASKVFDTTPGRRLGYGLNTANTVATTGITMAYLTNAATLTELPTPAQSVPVYGELDSISANIDGYATDEALQNEITRSTNADNVLSSSISLESNTRSSADIYLQQQINAVKGVGGYLQSNNFAVTTPSQEMLTFYAVSQIWPDYTDWEWNSSDPASSSFNSGGAAHTASEIFNGTRVKNSYNNHLWILSNTRSTVPTVFEWTDDGLDTVSTADNNGTLGVVTGDASSVYGVSVASDGKMSVNNGGKQFSTEDYTTTEKAKLSGIEDGAQENIIETVNYNGSPLQVVNKTVDIPSSGGGSGMSLGMVLSYSRSNIPPNCERADGHEVLGADALYPGPDEYTSFWQWLLAEKDAGGTCVGTYEDWQSQVDSTGAIYGTQNAFVGFYAVDEENKKFRFPMLNVFICGTSIDSEFGKGYVDQMQGHRHKTSQNIDTPAGGSATIYTSMNSSDTGPYKSTTLDPVTDNQNGTPRVGLETRPKHVKYPFMIVTYTNAIAASDIQAAEFINQVSVLASGNGFTPTGISNIRFYDKPDYAAEQTIFTPAQLGTMAEYTYNVLNDGYLVANLFGNNFNGAYLIINNATLCQTTANLSTYVTSMNSGLCKVSAGDVAKIKNGWGSTYAGMPAFLKFIPMKSISTNNAVLDTIVEENYITGLLAPDYSRAVSLTTNAVFVPPCDGYIQFNARCNLNGGFSVSLGTVASDNNVIYCTAADISSSGTTGGANTARVDKGQSYYIKSWNLHSLYRLLFIPCKGAN